MARGPSGRKHVAQKCNLGGGQSALPDPWGVAPGGGHLSVTWAGVEWRGWKGACNSDPGGDSKPWKE